MDGSRKYWFFYCLIFATSAVILAAVYWQSLLKSGKEPFLFLLAAIFGVSFGISFFAAVVMEGISFMVLIVPARIRKLKNEGRVEGRREQHREWVAWNERRISAERDGLSFDEPPPADPQDERGKKNGK